MPDISPLNPDPSNSVHPGTRRRADPGASMIVAGWFCVVLGGLIAAVTDPLDFSHGSWLAAYLVLVGGVAQNAMGRARGWQAEPERSSASAWMQVGGWNLGNALVIAGTLVSVPLVVDAGSLLLVIALLIAFRATLPLAGTDPESPLLFRTYRILLLILIVSIPVGIVLSHLRHG